MIITASGDDYIGERVTECTVDQERAVLEEKKITFSSNQNIFIYLFMLVLQYVEEK